MITLDEYKHVLVNHFFYEIDNTLEMYEKRMETLTKRYEDKYLQKIIDNTSSLIKSLCQRKNLYKPYHNVPLINEGTSYISLGLCGGGFSDQIFIDKDGNHISKFILKHILGDFLTVEYLEECREKADPNFNDLITVYSDYYLYLQGIPADVQYILNNLENKRLLMRYNYENRD